jgi:subtilase family serine protease
VIAAPSGQPGVTSTPTLPDLTLTMFEGVSSVQLGADGTISANYVIRVKNSGGQACGQFRVGVLLPSGAITTFDVPGLAVGQEFPIANGSLQVTFNSPGVTRILVTVDDQNVVTESSESNNQAYKDITVNPGIPTSTPQPTITPGG